MGTAAAPVLRVRTPPVNQGCQPTPNAPARTADLTAGRSAAEREINSRYFQLGRVCTASGRPDCTNFVGAAQVDQAFHFLVAERMRNTVSWPHIQELVIRSCVDYLQPGLNQLNGGNQALPALTLADMVTDDATALTTTRDLFVLKATLLSAYTRYSGSIAVLLPQLGTGTPTARLAALRRILATDQAFDQAVRNFPSLTPNTTNQRRLARAERSRREFQSRLSRAARTPGGDGLTEFDTLRAVARALRPPAPAQP